MTPAEFANWISIYVATGICCVIALALSVLSVGHELVKERAWIEATSSWRNMVLFAPRVWWRWQKRYLLSTPVTLAIVTYYGSTLNL